jgi:Na+-transporting NADH:ubiquinone oxidoreductase subunit C
MQHSPAYTFRFAATISVVASIIVATLSVALKDRQEHNRLLDVQKKVIDVAGLIRPGEKLSSDEVVDRYNDAIRPVVIDLSSGADAPEIDATAFDQRRASHDPATSTTAPDNNAGLTRLPNHAVVYHVMNGDDVSGLILPIEGSALWGTVYGFIALSSDLRTIQGITFYEHKETPGLGGEIENLGWRALWEGRRAFDDDWIPQIRVIKGPAGSGDHAPFEVDGLAGATITGRGITNLVQFWLGSHGFGPYLERFRTERANG